MPLEYDDLVKITLEMTTGKKSGVVGKDADEFRKKLAVDIALAKKRGWVIEIPAE